MQPTPLQPTGRHMCDRGPLAALLAALLACWRFFGFWRDDNAYSVGPCHQPHMCKGASRLIRCRSAQWL
ncbi:hypothetical protein GGI43DRAFT_391584, partial [Trichoderma evansii]